jgi:hypothetical protein
MDWLGGDARHGSEDMLTTWTRCVDIFEDKHMSL